MNLLDKIGVSCIISIVSELLTRAGTPNQSQRSIVMNKFNQLNKDIVNSIQLFAEFGQRGYYERKGKVIVMNDVTDPEREGVFLARCARKIARKQGVEYAHEWAMKAFVDGVYNRLQIRNKGHETERQKVLSDMRLFGPKALIATRA